ncbi:MAG TPA: 50S ribosomal protein L2 [Flavobacterium sp.]
MIHPFKTFKPLTAGIRTTRLLNKSDLLQNIKPLKRLTQNICLGTGRNHHGHITSWRKGGGHFRLYRKVNFYRDNNSFGVVEGTEYDPNRSTNIIRVFNPDFHNHSYVLAVKNLRRGYCIRNYLSSRIGNHLFLKDVPTGFVINNLSKSYGKKGTYLRAAGTYGQIIFKTQYLARIKLRSGEHRIFPVKASATLGSLDNENLKFIKLGKAGRNRWYGVKPVVRGVAINPVDHPHGGGEGRTSGGRPSVTPWGKPTKNQPTKKKIVSVRVELKKKKR